MNLLRASQTLEQESALWITLAGESLADCALQTLAHGPIRPWATPREVQPAADIRMGHISIQQTYDAQETQDEHDRGRTFKLHH